MFLIIAGGQVCARHVCDKGDTENSLGIKQQLSPSSACHKWGNPQSSREGQLPIDGVNSYLTKALRQFKMCITHAWTGIMSYLLKMKYWSNAFKFVCVCYYMPVTDWCNLLWLLQRQDHVEMEDLTVARESLEVLTVCLMLCPPALDALNKDKSWQTFIKDLLLHCKNRSVTRLHVQCLWQPIWHLLILF